MTLQRRNFARGQLHECRAKKSKNVVVHSETEGRNIGHIAPNIGMISE